MIARVFPKLNENIYPHIYLIYTTYIPTDPKAPQTVQRKNIKTTMPRYIIIKLTKPMIKIKILKTVKEKEYTTYKGTKIRKSRHF